MNSHEEPPPRTVKPAHLPTAPKPGELEFHRLALISIEENLDAGVDPLTFPASWIRMWIDFDRRIMHELGHRPPYSEQNG